MQTQDSSALSVRNLRAGFAAKNGVIVAVDDVSFDVPKGKTLGLVGESGCGKSVTAMSIMRLLPNPTGRILGGSIELHGRNLVDLSIDEMRKVRGKQVGMVFQEPMTALNPVHRIGQQLSECFFLHYPKINKKEAWDRSIEALKRVGIPAPEVRVTEYPHQLSGGMRQRVVIAMALACDPEILICDEPTTALDVTIQAQILDLIGQLQADLGMSVVMITHDLGVIAETCNEVVVMYAGRVAERASVFEIFENPQHLYTQGLLSSIPKLESHAKQKLATIPGMVPSLADMPVGARFAPRSNHPAVKDYLASAEFKEKRPELVEYSPGHWVEDCEYVRAFG
ncbi:ABC transporter ATP-binding protein [Pelagicoccus albus]|uniref:ABC transporter ATP-binding protein n=1 Tax=Pelagicoccus albus TaxID=415222 RepID=A0A7X1E872_9BACT|nr:ABC transporter ATP-binding protein [Pelagicoccus albus]MBC2606049.1 ABC transporter ATP-binding protein [Pelagicoccus albus]